MTLKLTTIRQRHDRKKFDCGYKELNDFLARNARSSNDKRMTRTYILEDPDRPDTVMGYVTLTYTTVELPEGCDTARRRKLKFESPLPALLLAKMAVSKDYKGNGYGQHLLTFAIKQASIASAQVGGIGLIVDAKDEPAKQFYLEQGGEDFEIIDESGLKLWLPIDLCDYIARVAGE